MASNAKREVLAPPGTFRDMSLSGRGLLAWIGMALVVGIPLVSPILFTSAYDYWGLFWFLVIVGLLMWYIGMQITYRIPNLFFIVAAIYALILGAINLFVAETAMEEVFMRRYRYDANGIQRAQSEIAAEHLWTITATILFFILFVALEISMYQRRNRLRRREREAERRAPYRADVYRT